jgi:Holliday junction resolvase RusA-like endonuclease
MHGVRVFVCGADAGVWSVFAAALAEGEAGPGGVGVSSLSFTVPGTPVPKARPRRSKHGGVYTPASTTQAEERVKKAWMDAGGFSLGDGPLSVTVDAYFARPPSHYNRNGSLSAAGKRATVPGRCDGDNVAKLVLDSCNGLAYKDDRQVVALHAHKWWCVRGEPECVVVRLRAL